MKFYEIHLIHTVVHVRVSWMKVQLNEIMNYMLFSCFLLLMVNLSGKTPTNYFFFIKKIIIFIMCYLIF